jgi:hypothetical protein
MFVRKSKRKTLCGRHRCLWECGIKVRLWTVCVNAVMNLPVTWQVVKLQGLNECWLLNKDSTLWSFRNFKFYHRV